MNSRQDGSVFTGIVSSAAFMTLAAAGLSTLLAFLGPYWWFFALFCHFRVQYIIGSLFSAIVFFLRSKRLPALLALLTTIINFSLVAPMYTGPEHSPPTAERESTPLKALLLNVLASNTDYKRALSYIHGHSPDIIVLLEVSKAWEKALAPLRAEYPHGRILARNDCFGIALLSRLSLSSCRSVYFTKYSIATLVATLVYCGKTTTICAVHALPPTNRLQAEIRSRHLDRLAHSLAGLHGPVIVLGDFNATPWCPVFKHFIRVARLRDLRKGFGVKATWPTFWPFLRIPIDQCLASPPVYAQSFKVGGFVGSDHFPVVVELCIGKQLR